jgi:hypothetical protein
VANLVRKAYLRKGYKARTDAGTIARRTLAQQCMRLRADGLTHQQIVDRLDPDGLGKMDVTRVRDLINQEIKAQGVPSVEELRAEMIQQADRLFNRAVQIAMKDGNRDRVPALGMAFKAQERVAALMGLDAPKQTEIKDTTPREVAPTTAEDVMAQLAAEAIADYAKQGIAYDPSTGALTPLSE